jgi:hypothetical protein
VPDLQYPPIVDPAFSQTIESSADSPRRVV